MSGPERLYTSGEVAALLGVTPSAVSNWRKRGTGPLPEPRYTYRHTGTGRQVALWRAADIRPLLEARAADLAAVLDTLEESPARPGDVPQEWEDPEYDRASRPN